ncbi:MAG: glutathione-disulfide reductase [Burkholderiales bacterium]|nr:glutathione-disulfide reductase [Burkholderiales bacterium]
MKTVDLFVIGGGSGGVRAARIAAGHGASVALAEEYRVGGTCVIRGCVPKKLMVLASRFGQGFDDAAGFGWQLGERRFDWAALLHNVQNEVSRLEQAYTANLQRAGVTLHAERAVLADAHTVKLMTSGELIQARHVLIATGGAPDMGPAIPGAELAATSNDFFLWPTQPRRVLVQGAGYIALELACVLRRLGSEVTVVLRADRILRGFDDELREHLQAALADGGIVFESGSELTAIAHQADGRLRVQLNSGRAIEADAVLRATGRRPATAGLGLEQAGVALDDNGAVVVNAFSTSISVPHIHAVGDVTDRVALTPAAIREGHALADTLFGGKPTPVHHAWVPTAVFTTPELGVIGLTEHEATQAHPAVDIYVTRFRPMQAVLAGRAGQTLMKLVVDAQTDRVLGAHLAGPESGEMIQLLGVALQMGARKADLDATLAVHPTAAEELVTLRTPTRRHGAG